MRISRRLGIASLIAGRRRLEHDNERLHRLYRMLGEANRGIIRLTDRLNVFDGICDVAVRHGGFPLAWVAEPTPDGAVLRRSAASGEVSLLDGLDVPLDSHDADPDPVTRAYCTGDVQVLPDLAALAADPAGKVFPRRLGHGALAAFPLRRDGGVAAVLAVYARDRGTLGDIETRMLSELAENVSFALDNELRERDMRIAAVAFELQEGILVTDSHNVIERVNHAFTRITGYDAADVIGQTPRMLRSGRHDEEFYQEMWRRLTEDGTWEGEVWNRRKNGEVYPEWLAITAVRDTEDRVTHYVGSFTDITDSKANENKIHHLAFYDPLTDLANRRLLIDRLGRALALSARNQTYGAVLMLDFDHFKMLNDTRGHAAGDTLLVEAAGRLRRGVRQSDSVARIGGDEFIVVLEGLDGNEDVAGGEAVRRAHQLQSALGKPYSLPPSNDYRITVSVGIALFKGHDLLVDDLLKQADVALYEAKADGRNALRFFNPEQQRAIEVRASLEEELRRAIHNNEFELHYQPQIDRRGAVIGAETLLRWTPPGREPVSPGEFIPVAEETGQVMAIGDWVLNAALGRLRAWQQDPAMRHLTLSVNISAKHFHQSGFADDVRRHLESSGADPSGLYLELTENVGIEPLDRVMRQFEALKALNVRFSIDDFGTGYSSLSYLQQLPVDQIKIDRSFVDGLPDNANSAAVVRAILAMGHAFDLHVIAEGVETEQQHSFLLKAGCDAYQGYYFGPPVAIDEFEATLRAGGYSDGS